MRWRILGPVEADIDGKVLDFRRPQQRAVLALLLLDAGRVVSPEQLINALWTGEPPRSSRTQVQVCVSRIRAALRGAGLTDVLLTQAGGYRLVVGPDELDLAVFTGAVAQARTAVAAGQPATAAELLGTGLALWRGPALAGAAGAFVESAAARLDEQRLSAYEQLATAELTLGRHADVIEVLRPVVDAHPLRESLISRYLLALAGAGQRARALEVYAETRRRLVEELGVEPAAELAAAHLRVLRHDMPDPEPEPQPGPRPASVPPPDAVPIPAAPVPAQLPTDVPGFTGRQAELRALDALLDGADGAGGRAVVISAIGGTAGVGKTALAVHWAHRTAHRFPDGQLYVNLRGFDPGGRAVGPAEALLGFLEALQVPRQQVPTELSRQAALYRTLMAGRRVLVLLDNARDAEQVRDLLPGAPGCLVVVTSRNRLTGLVIAEGARPLTLDLLTATESRELLRQRIGRDRTTADLAAVEEIIRRCAGLPLALAVVAARASTHPHLPLAALAAELRDVRGGDLAAFDTGDPATDVRAVLSWSYRALEPDAARLFRLLGLHPGPDAGQPALASLAGIPPARVRPLLARLTGAHLLTEHAPGRYAQHDLLASYAAELCHTIDSEVERAVASHRLFDHYLHTTHAADRLLDPYRLAVSVVPAAPRPDVTSDEPVDHPAAMAWFAAEQDVLLAVVDRAGRAGFDDHAWQLAAVLTTYLDRRGHWHDLIAVQRTALDAARRGANRLGRAHAHRGLAIACTWLGRNTDAHVHYQRVLDLYRELADPVGQAHTHVGVSWILAREGRHDEALDQTGQALSLYRAAGYLVGQAKALNNLSWLHARLDHHELALNCSRRALTLHEENEDRHGAALAWDNLGYAQHRLGRHDEALRCYRRALDLHRALGDRYDEAEVLANLGETYQFIGAPEAARSAWQAALAIFDELDHPDADGLRTRLAASPPYVAGPVGT
ncbi:BTAD domain-containing putative transcriptional regulator [Polymorphospora sp. NPDC051019]|uniref:AfsR/SARP family transcriptional regulator n=1 Tax=Polymorphospora sp. NPDC051019 TaxID=3155725 RepID=UPI00341CA102